LEFWELRWRKFYNPGFSASQLHVLLQFKPLQFRVQEPFYRSGRGILQFGADRELGSLVSRPQPGSHKWVSRCNSSALRQKYFPPDTHHFVRGSGIPIHPGDLEVVSLRREDFHGDGVTLACLNELADIEFKGSVGAGNLGFVGDLSSIDPEIRAIVNSQEIQPGLLVLIVGWQIELRAKPPRATKRASLRHVVIGKELFVGLKNSWIRSEIVCPERIRIRLIGNQCAHHCCRNVCLVPALRVEPGRGNLLARGLYLARRLNLPILVQIRSLWTLTRRISGIVAGAENSAQRKNADVRRTQERHEAPSRFGYSNWRIENNAPLRPGGPILNRLNALNTLYFTGFPRLTPGPGLPRWIGDREVVPEEGAEP